MWSSRALFLCSCAIVTGVQVTVKPSENSRLVQTAQGPVRGYLHPNGGLFVFYGIPYAQAPTGRDKFKAPQPGKPWNEPLEAVDNSVVCPQPKKVAHNKKIEEDCLRANIFVPATKHNNIPVVVYVHGGAYQIGSGSLIKPTQLVKTQNVIVVTFNYRLGAHGFLCLGTPDAPGNAGLKDQVAALRWVKQNIANFGGNPNKVTIAGFSAGSHSVELLLISETTTNLFQGISAESGAGIGPAIVVDPLKKAKEFAKTLNFTNVDDIHALEEFYKTASIESITDTPLIDNLDGSLDFAPCVEREPFSEREKYEEAFMDEDPETLIRRGHYQKVPMLYGFANMEGLLRLQNFDKWKNMMNQKFSDFLPVDLQFENAAQKEEVAKKVKEFYFGDKSVGDDTILQWIAYFGDVLFIYPMLRSVKLHIEAGHTQIYLYEYSFVDKGSSVVPHTNVSGANHCAETHAVLDGENESNITQEFKHMKRLMRDLWGHFIRTGMPAPPGSNLPMWPSTHADRAPHMSLTLPPQLGGRLLPRMALFWDDIYARHYRPATWAYPYKDESLKP